MPVGVSYEMVGSSSLAIVSATDGPDLSICFLTIPNLGGVGDPDELTRKIGELGLQGVAKAVSAGLDEVASEIVALALAENAAPTRRQAANTFAYQVVRKPLLSTSDQSNDGVPLAGRAGWELDSLVGKGLGASLARPIGPAFQVALVGTGSCLTVLGSETAVRALLEDRAAPIQGWLGRRQ